MDYRNIEREASEAKGEVSTIWLRTYQNADATICENRDRYSEGDLLALAVDCIRDILADGADAEAVAFYAARGIVA